MNWYTLENGRLCLGTNKLQFANFHIATDLKLNFKVSQPLLAEHVELIGSFPEDWCSDESIDHKVNNIARHLFGLSSNSTDAFFA